MCQIDPISESKKLKPKALKIKLALKSPLGNNYVSVNRALLNSGIQSFPIMPNFSGANTHWAVFNLRTNSNNQLDLVTFGSNLVYWTGAYPPSEDVFLATNAIDIGVDETFTIDYSGIDRSTNGAKVTLQFGQTDLLARLGGGIPFNQNSPQGIVTAIGGSAVPVTPLFSPLVRFRPVFSIQYNNAVVHFNGQNSFGIAETVFIHTGITIRDFCFDENGGLYVLCIDTIDPRNVVPFSVKVIDTTNWEISQTMTSSIQTNELGNHLFTAGENQACLSVLGKDYIELFASNGVRSQVRIPSSGVVSYYMAGPFIYVYDKTTSQIKIFRTEGNTLFFTIDLSQQVSDITKIYGNPDNGDVFMLYPSGFAVVKGNTNSIFQIVKLPSTPNDFCIVDIAGSTHVFVAIPERGEIQVYTLEKNSYKLKFSIDVAASLTNLIGLFFDKLQDTLFIFSKSGLATYNIYSPSVQIQTETFSTLSTINKIGFLPTKFNVTVNTFPDELIYFMAWTGNSALAIVENVEVNRANSNSLFKDISIQNGILSISDREWNPTNIEGYGMNLFCDICYSGSNYIIVGIKNNNGPDPGYGSSAIYSTDKINWRRVSVRPGQSIEPSYQRVLTLHSSRNACIALSMAGHPKTGLFESTINVIFTSSSNAMQWGIRCNVTCKVGHPIREIADSSDSIYGVGQNGIHTITISDLGVVSTTPVENINTSLRSICYGGKANNKMFIAVGVDGTIAKKSSGSSWETITSSPNLTTNLVSVCWNESLERFFICGQDRLILTSIDGTHWHQIYSGVSPSGGAAKQYSIGEQTLGVLGGISPNDYYIIH